MAKKSISDPFTAAAATNRSTWWSGLFGASDPNLTHASDFRRRRLLGFDGGVLSSNKHGAGT